MSIVSKHLFYSKIGPELKCNIFLHKWTDNCVSGNYKIARDNFINGVTAFYFPIYLIKLLYDYKKLDKHYAKTLLKSYLLSVCFGISYGYLGLSGICACSKISGRLHYYGFALIPGFIAGASIFFESTPNKIINASLWFSLVIEALFLNAYYFKIIHYSKSRETAIFMFANSLLMYLFARVDKKNIPLNMWFYGPQNLKTRNEHAAKQCFLDFVNYFQIGFGLSTARFLFSRGKNCYKQFPETVSKAIFNKKSFKYGIQFGSYAGIFRIVLYLLQKYSNKSHGTCAAIAGFITGATYTIKPSVNLLAMLIATNIQILCKQIVKVPKSCKFFPYTELLFIVCNGLLFHNKVAAGPTCPKYYSNMVSVATNGFIDKQINMALQDYIFKN